jgi:Na+-transporting methylmalonyl-CoA/oxaloacetate decarboxylase gamma subunit
MKPAVFIGVVLIVLSILSFAYQDITHKTREKVLDIGPIEATAEKQKTIPLPPVFGAMALIGGITLVIIGNKS